MSYLKIIHLFFFFFWIDPTIANYELQIPNIFIEIAKENSDERLDSITRAIVKQFVKHINFLKENENIKKESKIDTISVEFKGDELKGIKSHLEEKFGENLCEQGII